MDTDTDTETDTDAETETETETETVQAGAKTKPGAAKWHEALGEAPCSKRCSGIAAWLADK